MLQQKVYEPLGSVRAVATNARVIAATHRHLEEMVKSEKFREDLFFRINVFRISLPPLSERKEDIPLLVDHFIERFNRQKGRQVAEVSRNAMQALMAHDWPGNVRELENVIEHGFILCREDLIRLEDLPIHMLAAAASSGEGGRTLKDIEKAAILQELSRQNGKKMPAAPRARDRQEHPSPQDDPAGNPIPRRPP